MRDHGTLELSTLNEIAHQRGFRALPVAAVVLVANIPVAILAALREPGYSSAIPISVFFVLFPAAALLVWSLIDREGRSAREIVLWLKAGAQGPADGTQLTVQAAVDRAWTHLANRESLTELANRMTDELLPIVRDRRGARVRIVLYHFWFVVVWVPIAVTIAAIFLVAISVAPDCATLGEPTAISICR